MNTKVLLGVQVVEIVSEEGLFLFGGVFNNYVSRKSTEAHVTKGILYVKCPCLSTRGGRSFKIGSNFIHVVAECPFVLFVTRYIITFYCLLLQKGF